MDESYKAKGKEHDAALERLRLQESTSAELENKLATANGQLQMVNGKLQMANDRWHAFSNGPSNFDDALNTPLPGPVNGELEDPRKDVTSLHKPGQSSSSSSSTHTPSFPVLDPATPNVEPVRNPQSSQPGSPAQWRTEKQAKEVHDQLIALQRAQLVGRYTTNGSQPLPSSLRRRNSMGSVFQTNGIAATNLAGFAPRPLAFNLGNAAHHSGNGTVPDSAQPSPLASQRGASSDNNGPPNTSNGVRQSEQPPSSVSAPPVHTTTGSTSPHRNTTSTPATPSPSPGPTKGPGDAASADTLPTGDHRPGTSSSDALHKSAATSTPVPQGADSSIDGKDDTRGRSTTPSNAPVPSTAPGPDRSRGSPLRTNMEDIHEAARKARMAEPINGLDDAT
ncbi:MAG: hypothetical protein Q9180_008653, partial [Flavoplaca navasiana]